MIDERLTLHNVGEAILEEGRPGIRLQRVPERVRRALNERAQWKMLATAGMEIRLVPEDWSRPVRLTLSAREGVNGPAPLRVSTYWGTLQGRQEWFIGDEPETIEVVAAEPLRAFPLEELGKLPFDPHVCRVILEGEGVFLHEVEGDFCAPRADETPARTLLCYGTSITQGACASRQHLSYASVMARRLGVDLLNLGSGGSAHCEREIAEYMAGLDWDFASLSLSVNMLGGFSVEAFSERARTMVTLVAESKPEAPVLCTSILPHRGDWGEGREKSAAFREALRGICDEAPLNVSYVDGPAALTHLDGLTEDMLHPSDHGMLEVGTFLADFLGKVTEGREG